MGKKTIDELKAALAEQFAKGAEADLKTVEATVQALAAAYEEKVSEVEATYEQDVAELNGKLAEYEAGKVKVQKPTVTVAKQKYRVMYPTIDLDGVKYTSADIKANTEVVVEGKKIGLADHLVKIGSGALKVTE